MGTYREVIAKYRAGLISREEANKAIDLINMGSDCYTYNRV